ncbi:MAG: terpene cyclase/mutase family protein [Thermoguttaceae bacterium]|nr:terpene cyclase/mutase family protein [Thermoguttaceae bacterium]
MKQSAGIADHRFQKAPGFSRGNSFLPALLFIFLLFALVGNLYAQNEPEACVERGLNYFREKLARGIMPGDGAFRNDSAITALVGMALLSSGSTPTEGPDAAAVQKCVDFILKNQRKNGVLASTAASEQGTVYAHGFAVTFLAECLGMSPDDSRLRTVLERGVQLIVKAQGPNGGWRYTFQPGEEDVSVTACFLNALRACRNAGISVPSETVQRGVEYLLKCQNSDGGFRYRLTPGPSAYPRTAAAVTGLCSAGIYDSPEIQRAMIYLRNSTLMPPDEDGYWFYAQYYAVQAFRLTDTQPEVWNHWFALLVKRLRETQKPDGSWNSTISLDCATAMALIAIQAETNYLPIFQR